MSARQWHLLSWKSFSDSLIHAMGTKLSDYSGTHRHYVDLYDKYNIYHSASVLWNTKVFSMKSLIFIVTPFEVIVGRWPLASYCGSSESSHALASFLFISFLLESQNPHLWRPTLALCCPEPPTYKRRERPGGSSQKAEDCPLLKLVRRAVGRSDVWAFWTHGDKATSKPSLYFCGNYIPFMTQSFVHDVDCKFPGGRYWSFQTFVLPHRQAQDHIHKWKWIVDELGFADLLTKYATWAVTYDLAKGSVLSAEKNIY